MNTEIQNQDLIERELRGAQVEFGQGENVSPKKSSQPEQQISFFFSLSPYFLVWSHNFNPSISISLKI